MTGSKHLSTRQLAHSLDEAAVFGPSALTLEEISPQARSCTLLC